MPTTTVPTFECDVCSQQHEIPLNIGFSMPDFVNKLLPWEREERSKSSEDWCMVDDQFFYLRGCLEVPIAGTQSVLSWGVWTSLSEDDFDSTMELWNDPARAREPLYKCSLANTLPTYDETRNLPLDVATRNVGDRPLLVLADTEHQLALHQRQGMPLENAIELAKVIIHGQSSNPWSHLCER